MIGQSDGAIDGTVVRSRIRTHGRARIYEHFDSVEALREKTREFSETGIRFYVLGAASNVLISDSYFPSAVIRLGGAFKTVDWREDDGEVVAGAGVSLVRLGMMLAKRSCWGGEFMCAIPGTVGGSVRMNAGTTHEGEIKDLLVSARLFDPVTGEVTTCTNDDLRFGYRQSAVSGTHKIVLSARFALRREAGVDAKERHRRILETIAVRNANQPEQSQTFGSTFKRPEGGKPAGWYLARVGMKGQRIGDAMYQEKHANWIINIGDARADDIKALIEEGRRRVFEEFGVQLDREVIYLPEDMKQWN